MMFQPETSKSPVHVLKKLMRLSLSVLRWGFNPSKCKTEAKLATARIKLLRNRRQAQVRQMRCDIAALLQSGRDDTARIRVEHVIREQNIMAANEIIELFCEQVVVRLPIIAKQRDCPADLKEGISSLIYASSRCSDIPELNRIRDIFEKKYGKDFVSAATDLRPNSGVNHMLIEKLSVRKPTGEVKLKIMKEIAKEYQVEWDTTESELELLNPPEEVLEGPRSFVSAASMPLKHTLSQQDSAPNELRSHADKRSYSMNFKDTASAAQAAAEAAEKAAYAAQAAAVLAKQSAGQSGSTSSLHASTHGLSERGRAQRHSLDSAQSVAASSSSVDNFKRRTTISACQTFDGLSYVDSDNMDPPQLDNEKFHRRLGYTARKVHTEINFDDSDGWDSAGDDEDEMIPPPSRPPPVVPPRDVSEQNEPANEHSVACKTNQASRVHPKLPDYEDLAARFEALKSRRS